MSKIRTLNITKYRNRKLYNSERSSYVNLVELIHAVSVGTKVVITDSTTGKDVTCKTLAQGLALYVDVPLGDLTAVIRDNYLSEYRKAAA